MRLASLRQSGCVAPVAELFAKGVAAVWLAGRRRQERQVFARRGVEDRTQVRMHGDRELSAGFLLFHRELAVLDVLAAHADDIAAPLRGVEQQRQPKARLRADGMMRLELRNLVLGPCVKSVALDRAQLDVPR